MSTAKLTHSAATPARATGNRSTTKTKSGAIVGSSIVELEEMMTIEEASTMLKMSVRYVRRLVAERRIVFYRLGRSVRFKPVDLASFIELGRVEPITISDVWVSQRSVA